MASMIYLTYRNSIILNCLGIYQMLPTQSILCRNQRLQKIYIEEEIHRKNIFYYIEEIRNAGIIIVQVENGWSYSEYIRRAGRKIVFNNMLKHCG